MRFLLPARAAAAKNGEAVSAGRMFPARRRAGDGVERTDMAGAVRGGSWHRRQGDRGESPDADGCRRYASPILRESEPCQLLDPLYDAAAGGQAAESVTGAGHRLACTGGA